MNVEPIARSIRYTRKRTRRVSLGSLALTAASVGALHRKLTKEALDWANRERIKQGFEPMADLPRGIRDSVDQNPVARAVGFPVPWDVEIKGWDENDPVGNILLLWVQYPHYLWLAAFDGGFYGRYNEATAYVKLPMPGAQFFDRAQVYTSVSRERYLRGRQRVRYLLQSKN